MSKVVLWLMRLFPGLSPPRFSFNPGPEHVRFVVGKEALRASPVSVIPPTHHTLLRLNNFAGRTIERNLGNFTQTKFEDSNLLCREAV
jgi:hypothetical protein